MNDFEVGCGALPPNIKKTTKKQNPATYTKPSASLRSQPCRIL